MKILAMSATFGKLDGSALTLKPDLNVITAPNEWGKSTWCSFIVAMLYGIETGQRTSGKGLADKERFAPWNGKPMSGRMDIQWNGRKITLERSSKGRSIFGVFKAYETDTGLEVTELTAQNCGLTLLGVEKNVFLRAGFVRQTEMPVTDDIALRRRLNELVTTGDESGASDKLAKALKDLKNACRYNKTGLLPQAEGQKAIIEEKLRQIETAKLQMEQIGQRQEQLKTEIAALENHKAHLAYREARENSDRVAAAEDAAEKALSFVRTLETQCADLPAKEFAEKKIAQAEALQIGFAQLQTKDLPSMPNAPESFRGLSPEDACQKAKADKASYDLLKKPLPPTLLILAAVCLLAGVGLLFIHPALSIIGLLGSVLFGILYYRKAFASKKAMEALSGHYGTLPADQWEQTANAYREQVEDYRRNSKSYNEEKSRLQSETEALTGGKSLPEFMDSHRDAIKLWQKLDNAKEESRRASQHAQALAAVVKEIPAPREEDVLTCTAQETQRRLEGCNWEQGDLQRKMGQFMGQVQTLGNAEDLRRQLQQVNARIAKLEDTYAALVIAQQTLTDAANELQRRFAPVIAKRAQELFSQLTGGRYNRLILGQDLTVEAAAQGEDNLHTATWRSDGTVDQLYLAVRLAVAEALTPDAPIVLDDALVRFDDTRLDKTMALLKELSGGKQVILFSCQDRESNYA